MSQQSALCSQFGPKINSKYYRGADKFLARPGKKHATTTEDFDFDISYFL